MSFLRWTLCFVLIGTLIGCDESNDGESADAGDTTGDTEGQPTDSSDGTDEGTVDTGAEDEPSLCLTSEAVCKKGEILECDDLEDPENVGHLAAKCLPDCSGWDKSACLRPEQMLQYGEVEVDLKNEFTLDPSKIGEEAYQDEHLDTIITTEPAFYGVVGGVKFPKENVQDYEILVLRGEGEYGGEIAITQQAFDSDGKLVNPTVQLNLPQDNYKTGGEIEVCLGQKVTVFVYDLNPATFKIDCFHAVTAEGWMDVITAEGLTESDGGRLSLKSRDVFPLYYMKNTPHGDFEEEFEYPICSRLDEGVSK